MNRLQRVRRLFDEVIELDPEARESTLREHARHDPALVEEVNALVKADTHPYAKFEIGAAGLLAELAEGCDPQELCGTEFGPYHIERLIGAGGMAHVYEATRTVEGVARRVALKVLRPELDSAAFIARFGKERATLAGLEHEHIVAFLDAGKLPDGRPFLVMEFVVGEPLTVWARGKSQEERLTLFLQVAAAVQYAHSKLLVHRDLKPSNVLVTPLGVPKLLDFGVAGAAQRSTDAGGEPAPLTPAYASPEQLRGDPITTASDIFGLGVLLQELVCGERTLDSGGAKPARDLACIVAKATQTDPLDRYRSADQLGDDLRRFLRREPIDARPSTLGYRLRLGVLRNRWAVALAGTSVLALAAGWLGADFKRRTAESEASLGWGAHAQARCAAGLLEECVVSQAFEDPDLAAGVADKLERAIAEDVVDLPEAETLLRIALARVYQASGERDLASGHAARAFELAQTTRGIGSHDRARVETLLAELASDRR